MACCLLTSNNSDQYSEWTVLLFAYNLQYNCDICVIKHFSFWKCGRVWRDVGRVLAITWTRAVILLRATDRSSITHRLKTFWVVCSEWVCCAIAVMTDRSISAFATHYCACSSIAFLARIISLSVCIIHYVECEDDWGLLIWKECWRKRLWSK